MREREHKLSSADRGSAKLSLAILVLVAYTLLVAASAAIGYRVLSKSAARSATTAEFLHVMGRQRALTQAVVVNALETTLVVADPEAFELAHHALERSISALEESRTRLLDAASADVHQLVQDPDHRVDERVQEHIRLGRAILARPRLALSVDDPSLVSIRAKRVDMLAEIDWMIGEEKALVEAANQNLRRLLISVAMASVILLGFQVLVIAPLTRRTRDEIRSMADEQRERDVLNQEILDNMTEGVVVADAAGNFLTFNRAAREMLGIGESHETVAAWPEVYPFYRPDGETLVPADKLPMARALGGEQLHREGLCYRRSDDPELRYLEFDALPLSMEPGKPNGAVVVFAEITERKRLALERERVEQEAHREETRRAEALEVEVMVRRRAEQSLRAKGEELARSNAELAQFAYVASHDLKAPLRTVGSFVELLRQRYQELLDAKGEQYVDFIVEGVTRMQALLDALLEYSQVGAEPEELIPIDTRDALSSAVANLRATIESSQAQVALPRAMPVVAGRAPQLIQLFQNLLGNAIKFQREGAAPQIAVSVESEGAYAHFLIEDNGIGIDPRFHEKIFRIFQRLHRQDTYEGAGVGLAICKKIVERHGGKIWVESASEQGTIIHVLLRQIDNPRLWERPDRFVFDPEPLSATTLE